MKKEKWTTKRKELCEKFWDHCAQEKLYCKNCAGVPCDVILEAEKEEGKEVKERVDFSKLKTREVTE